MRPWGCTAYVHDTSSEFGKLGPRGKKSVFVRYSDVSKGYVFVREQDSGTITEFESRDVIFIENEFPKLGQIGQEQTLYETQDMDASGSLHSSGRNFTRNENVDSLIETDANVPNPESSGRIIPYSSGSIDYESSGPSGTIPIEPRKSTRKRNLPLRFRDCDSTEVLSLDLSDDEPRNVQEALSGPTKDKWIKAME